MNNMMTERELTEFAIKYYPTWFCPEEKNKDGPSYLETEIEPPLPQATKYYSSKKLEKLKDIPCPECPEKFLFERDLKKHLKQKRNAISQNGAFQCSNCNVRFAYSYGLSQHKCAFLKMCTDCNNYHEPGKCSMIVTTCVHCTEQFKQRVAKNLSNLCMLCTKLWMEATSNATPIPINSGRKLVTCPATNSNNSKRRKRVMAVSDTADVLQVSKTASRTKYSESTLKLVNASPEDFELDCDNNIDTPSFKNIIETTKKFGVKRCLEKRKNDHMSRSKPKIQELSIPDSDISSTLEVNDRLHDPLAIEPELMQVATAITSTDHAYCLKDPQELNALRQKLRENYRKSMNGKTTSKRSLFKCQLKGGRKKAAGRIVVVDDGKGKKMGLVSPDGKKVKYPCKCKNKSSYCGNSCENQQFRCHLNLERATIPVTLNRATIPVKLDRATIPADARAAAKMSPGGKKVQCPCKCKNKSSYCGNYCANEHFRCHIKLERTTVPAKAPAAAKMSPRGKKVKCTCKCKNKSSYCGDYCVNEQFRCHLKLDRATIPVKLDRAPIPAETPAAAKSAAQPVLPKPVVNFKRRLTRSDATDKELLHMKNCVVRLERLD